MAGAVTNASIATSETWKDRQTGEQKERTEWHRVVFRDRGNYRLGQIAGEYLKKGSKVYVEGSLQTRKWQDKSGQDRYTTEIVGNEMQMLDSRGCSDRAVLSRVSRVSRDLTISAQSAPQAVTGRSGCTGGERSRSGKPHRPRTLATSTTIYHSENHLC